MKGNGQLSIRESSTTNTKGREEHSVVLFVVHSVLRVPDCESTLTIT